MTNVTELPQELQNFRTRLPDSINELYETVTTAVVDIGLLQEEDAQKLFMVVLKEKEGSLFSDFRVYHDYAKEFKEQAKTADQEKVFEEEKIRYLNFIAHTQKQAFNYNSFLLQDEMYQRINSVIKLIDFSRGSIYSKEFLDTGPGWRVDGKTAKLMTDYKEIKTNSGENARETNTLTTFVDNASDVEGLIDNEIVKLTNKLTQAKPEGTDNNLTPKEETTIANLQNAIDKLKVAKSVIGKKKQAVQQLLNKNTKEFNSHLALEAATPQAIHDSKQKAAIALEELNPCKYIKDHPAEKKIVQNVCHSNNSNMDRIRNEAHKKLRWGEWLGTKMIDLAPSLNPIEFMKYVYHGPENHDAVFDCMLNSRRGLTISYPLANQSSDWKDNQFGNVQPTITLDLKSLSPQDILDIVKQMGPDQITIEKWKTYKSGTVEFKLLPKGPKALEEFIKLAKAKNLENQKKVSVTENKNASVNAEKGTGAEIQENGEGFNAETSGNTPSP